LTVRTKPPPCVPLPVKAADSGDPGSELVTVSVPVRVPETLGVNVTCTAQLAPAVNVGSGQGIVTAKSPLPVARTVVIGAVPVFVSVSDKFAEAPTATLPNANVDGLSVSAGCIPTPVSATVSGFVDAEFVTDSVPGRVPPATGENVTCTVQPALAASELPGPGQVPPTA
jgi:hypothetical protein